MGMDGYLYSISTETYEEATQNPDEADDLMLDRISDEEYDGFLSLQQNWQLLHFLLSGDSDAVEASKPITKAVLGGRILGDEETASIRFLAPSEVAEIARALAETDPAALTTKYTAEDFQKAGLYRYEENRHQEISSFLIALYRDLSGFYEEAAAKGTAVVGYIS